MEKEKGREREREGERGERGIEIKKRENENGRE